MALKASHDVLADGDNLSAARAGESNWTTSEWFSWAAQSIAVRKKLSLMERSVSGLDKKRIITPMRKIADRGYRITCEVAARQTCFLAF